MFPPLSEQESSPPPTTDDVVLMSVECWQSEGKTSHATEFVVQEGSLNEKDKLIEQSMVLSVDATSICAADRV